MPELLLDGDYLRAGKRPSARPAIGLMRAHGSGSILCVHSQELITAARRSRFPFAALGKAHRRRRGHLPRNLCPLIKSSYGFARLIPAPIP